MSICSLSLVTITGCPSSLISWQQKLSIRRRESINSRLSLHNRIVNYFRLYYDRQNINKICETRSASTSTFDHQWSSEWSTITLSLDFKGFYEKNLSNCKENNKKSTKAGLKWSVSSDQTIREKVNHQWAQDTKAWSALGSPIWVGGSQSQKFVKILRNLSQDWMHNVPIYFINKVFKITHLL